MNPPPVAACLISGAESARIGRALASVRGLVSEIVVVLNEDAHDGTEEICRSHGAVVHRRPWGGFLAQKNLVQDLASQPWILQLDADEEVSPQLRSQILQFFQGDHERFSGASFPRKVWFLGRWITHGDWYPDRVLRLYRREAGRWSGAEEHCRIALQGSERRLTADLLHYTNPTITAYLHKIPYFADLYLKRQLALQARWSAPAVVFRSLWRFAKGYVFRAGFLDGYPGFFIAFSNAYATLFRHTRLYEHGLPRTPPPSDS
ncbi:MAG: glycosyltransferase family 2 protein [Verrucomicrobiae bacterium]|nr:glycosyltransferase family 2 protein [Verrucomicrobiae bacterium]